MLPFFGYLGSIDIAPKGDSRLLSGAKADYLRLDGCGSDVSFLSNAAGSSNGRTSLSEGEYLGSNPGPAAELGYVGHRPCPLI